MFSSDLQIMVRKYGYIESKGSRLQKNQEIDVGMQFNFDVAIKNNGKGYKTV